MKTPGHQADETLNFISAQILKMKLRLSKKPSAAPSRVPMTNPIRATLSGATYAAGADVESTGAEHASAAALAQGPTRNA
jgi:hypothetical protein